MGAAQILTVHSREGRSNTAIAQQLFVTEKAVSKHTTSIFTKLGLAASLGASVIADPADIPGTGRFAVLIDPQGAAFALFQG
jgi:predicted enzyme related to lactoylglutathione lyase